MFKFHQLERVEKYLNYLGAKSASLPFAEKFMMPARELTGTRFYSGEKLIEERIARRFVMRVADIIANKPEESWKTELGNLDEDICLRRTRTGGTAWYISREEQEHLSLAGKKIDLKGATTTPMITKKINRYRREAGLSSEIKTQSVSGYLTSIKVGLDKNLLESGLRWSEVDEALLAVTHRSYDPVQQKELTHITRQGQKYIVEFLRCAKEGRKWAAPVFEKSELKPEAAKLEELVTKAINLGAHAATHRIK